MRINVLKTDERHSEESCEVNTKRNEVVAPYSTPSGVSRNDVCPCFCPSAHHHQSNDPGFSGDKNFQMLTMCVVFFVNVWDAFVLF